VGGGEIRAVGEQPGVAFQGLVGPAGHDQRKCMFVADDRRQRVEHQRALEHWQRTPDITV